MDRRIQLVTRVPACLLLMSAAMLFGCPNLGEVIGEPVNDVTETLEGAIEELNRGSAQWQVTLTQLQANLVTQGQQTLANEVQSLIARGTAAIALETKCELGFLRRQLSDGVKGLLAKAQGRAAPQPIPHFCSVDPPSVDLNRAPGERIATLNIYGFNFNSSNIAVAVVDRNSRRTTPEAGFFNVPTEYMATFNVVNYPFDRASRYLSFSLPGGEERRVGIQQAPECGGIDQPCCSTGRACEKAAGCLSGICTACPAPYVAPALRTTRLLKVEKFDGNNCGGVNNVHTFGGPCRPGTHREACLVTLKETNSPKTSCRAVGGHGWASSDPKDCTCKVRFISDNHCFHGIRCDVEITQTEDPPPVPDRPIGCP